MSTVKKHPFPDRSNTGGNSAKQPQTQSSKPNAWSKPLPGSHPKKGATGTSGTNNSTSNRAYNKPPPGLSKPHPSEKSSHVHNLNAMRERYLHLLLTLVGQKVTVVMKSRVQYTGVLHTATPFSHLPEAQRHKYVLKAVTVEGDTDGSAPSVQPGQTIVLDMDSVVQLHVKSCRLDALAGSTKNSGNSSTMDAFTDTEISGANSAGRNHRGSDLIQADATWTSGADPGALPLNSRAAKLGGLSSSGTSGNTNTGALKGSIAGWDQFKANEELFNVVGSYDESVYTTKLDRNQFSASDRQRAEQIAREIESTSSTNMHIAEERGHVLSQDYDEEDRYSGVLKVNANTATASSKPKLNYAQAVTKTNDPVVPPGFDGETETATEPEPEPRVQADAAPQTDAIETTEEKKPDEVSPPEIAKSDETEVTLGGSEPVADSKTTDAPPLAESDTPASTEASVSAEPKFKLSASAKSFSFNINAKTFTPTPTPPPPPPPPPPPLPPPQFIDPATGMPILMTMGAPMMSEGMMPIMMNPGQYPGMRYAGHYPGVEHVPHPMPHGHQMQPAPPHPPATPAANSEAPSPGPVSDEGSVAAALTQPQEGDGSLTETSPQAPQQPPPPPPPPPPQQPIQHHIPVQSHMYFPNQFYPPPMGMVPQHHPQHFMHPQMSAHMQRHMYPMPAGMPPNMMRGPPQYYPTPNGPMPYPPTYGGGYNNEEDPMNYGGRGGRGGRGRATGGRAARGQGRGGLGGRANSGRGGRFNHQYSGVSNSSQGESGRNTPSDPTSTDPPSNRVTPTPVVSEEPTPAAPKSNEAPTPNASEPPVAPNDVPTTGAPAES